MTAGGKPLCIDLFCGLGGWAEGFLAEGWRVVGFDNHQHVYGEARYPAQLVIQDVLTLHGSQFRNADCIVASPPCQRYSYMAMPWSLAKREVRWQEWERDSPFGDKLADLNALFDACFRIQREASEAAGRHIPMVVENVKGAQKWVGRARANFGSYYLWGDIGMVGGSVVGLGRGMRMGEYARPLKRAMKHNPDGTDHPQDSWFAIADSKNRGASGQKVEGFNFHQHENGGPGGSFQSAAVNATKNSGGSWFNQAHNTESGTGRNPVHELAAFSDALKVPGINWNDRSKPAQGFNVEAAKRWREEHGNGVKCTGQKHGEEYAMTRGPVENVKNAADSFGWSKDTPLRNNNSRSDSRKAASAMIAKIPPALSEYIARYYHP